MFAQMERCSYFCIYKMKVCQGWQALSLDEKTFEANKERKIKKSRSKMLHYDEGSPLSVTLH